MNKLNKTRQQGTRTLIAITVIAVAVYIGFEPLIKFVPEVHGIFSSKILSTQILTIDSLKSAVNAPR